MTKPVQGGETPQPLDAEIHHPERGSIIVEIQDGPVFDENGRVVAIEGFVVDVTELRSFQRELENLVCARTAELQAVNRRLSEEIEVRRQAEDQLRASEESYRLLYHQSPMMMHSADRNGLLLNVNDQWLTVLGYVRDEVIGKNIIDFYLTPHGSIFWNPSGLNFSSRASSTGFPMKWSKKVATSSTFW